MKYVSRLKWNGLFLNYTICSLFVAKQQEVSACDSHLETYTDGASIFIQASSCKGARKKECGNNIHASKENCARAHTHRGTTHILLLGNAILLTFHFIQQGCLSSTWRRNLIYIKELTFENWPNDTTDILPKVSVSLIINHLSIVFECI